MGAWSGITENELITDTDLSDAVSAGIFTALTTIPTTNRVVTKERAITYVNLSATDNTFNGLSNTKMMNKTILASVNQVETIPFNELGIYYTLK
jgi:hypothetical protein